VDASINLPLRNAEGGGFLAWEVITAGSRATSSRKMSLCVGIYPGWRRIAPHFLVPEAVTALAGLRPPSDQSASVTPEIVALPNSIMLSHPDFRNEEALTLREGNVVTLHSALDLHFDPGERS
jgi:hypothetical protein